MLLVHRLQQYLPFTVLKLSLMLHDYGQFYQVATVLTVYGIETLIFPKIFVRICYVATVLTVYGIETTQF